MKSLLILLALTVSASAFAQQAKPGRMSLNDGSTIIRIDIGNEKNTDGREMAQRISRLERAVRELQNRIYDLEDDARQPQVREVTTVTCALTTQFNGTFIGKADNLIEARANAAIACEKKTGSNFWCKDQAQCQSSTVRQ